MVTRRIRHRYIDYDGNVVVKNMDDDLGPGSAGKTSSTGAIGIGQMQSRVKQLHGVSEMHRLNALGNAKTNPVTGQRMPGGWNSSDMTINKKEK